MINQVCRRLNQISNNITNEVAQELSKLIIELSTEAINQCPKDTGALRESFVVEDNGRKVIQGKEDGFTRTGTIQATDKHEIVAYFDTDYAVMQHEDLSLNHPTAGTKAKYLEDPFKQSDAQKRIEKAIKKGVR